MRREETMEAIKVMQEYADGKEIECLVDDEVGWKDIASPCWNWELFDYRVKPEPKVRPYTFEELCKAVNKHGNMIRLRTDCVYAIFYFDEKKNDVASCIEGYESYQGLMKYCWLDDNSPCGVVENNN